MHLEQTTLSVGTLVRGRYLIKNILGAGHSGTVYLVKDQQALPTQHEQFALKELCGLSQEERYRLLFSGESLRQLRHPALPVVYHIFNDDRNERIYLVMDYIEGVDLETLRQEQPTGRFPWLDLRTMLAPIGEALTYLHKQAQPVFHGDIKPLNLIRQASSGAVMLVDLGYAQTGVADTRGQFSSTHRSNLRAPEHLSGKIDEATDIYELGATLYVLLTGQTPVDAATRLQHTKKGEPDPLLAANELVLTLPRVFAEVLHRSLALDPTQRFVSMQDFWQALHTASGSTPAPQTRHNPGVPIAGGNETAATAGPATVSADSRSGGEARESILHRRGLIVVAIICALLLVGVGTWGVLRGQFAAGPQPSHSTTQAALQATSTAGHKVTPTTPANSGQYRNIAGVYQGKLYSLSNSQSTFSLTIQQQQSQINGTFSSPTQNGTFSGAIDMQGNVQFTVFNTLGDAVYSFTGGFNLPSANTLGGSFSGCAPGHGTTCQPVAYSGGGWVLTQSITDAGNVLQDVAYSNRGARSAAYSWYEIILSRVFE